MTANLSRSEARAKYHANLRINLDAGAWAVAIVGRQEWQRVCGLGNGITSATSALVTRCETRAEAERIAAELNDLEPGVMPGGAGAWVFAASRYDIDDYLCDNVRKFGRRKVDRRIAAL